MIRPEESARDVVSSQAVQCSAGHGHGLGQHCGAASRAGGRDCGMVSWLLLCHARTCGVCLQLLCMCLLSRGRLWVSALLLSNCIHGAAHKWLSALLCQCSEGAWVAMLDLEWWTALLGCQHQPCNVVAQPRFCNRCDFTIISESRPQVKDTISQCEA